MIGHLQKNAAQPLPLFNSVDSVGQRSTCLEKLDRAMAEFIT